MEIEELNAMLATLNVPVAYRQFKSTPTLPFVAFYETDVNLYGSDESHRKIKDGGFRIEMYSEIKDIMLESKVEKLLVDYDISKNESYISEEKMFMVAYEITEVKKIYG